MITDVFEYNQHFVAMMNVINAARLNPPSKGHRHHIIPRCWYKINNLPVDNSKDNLVLLTYEDHAKVHKLSILCAATPDLKSKMGFAVHRLLNGKFGGMHHTVETRRKMSEALKGRRLQPFTEEHRRKMSEALKGREFTAEHRSKMSEAKKGKHWKLVDGKRVWYLH